MYFLKTRAFFVAFSKFKMLIGVARALVNFLYLDVRGLRKVICVLVYICLKVRIIHTTTTSTIINNNNNNT